MWMRPSSVDETTWSGVGSRPAIGLWAGVGASGVCVVCVKLLARAKRRGDNRCNTDSGVCAH
jgi:hypothetical protein